MDSIELNKIAAAIVCAAALIGGCALLATVLVPAPPPVRSPIPIPGLQEPVPPPATTDAGTGGTR